MSNKKTSVNLTTNNYKKIKILREETGLTQSEIINQAISEVPIIVLGNQKNIAESFFEIRKLLAENDATTIKKEVNEVCRFLNLLMQKQEELMLLKEESIIS